MQKFFCGLTALVHRQPAQELPDSRNAARAHGKLIHAHTDKGRGQLRVASRLAAHTAGNVPLCSSLRRHGNEPQHGRMLRRIEVCHSGVAALDRKRILRQVVRADGEKVRLLREHIRADRRDRDFDHDADLDVRVIVYALCVEQIPRLAEHLLRVAQLVDRRDHREHDAQVAVPGGAQQRAQLHILTLQQLMEDFPAKLTGCMLLVTFDELDRSKLDLIASASPDILVLDGNFSRKPFFNVRWDYAAAAYRLVCWLTQLGHRNFVYINEDFSPDKNLIVFSGFQRQILQMHLPLNPVQIVMDAGSDPHVWSHLPEIVRKNNISAIFCTSDRTAVQAADHLLQAGLRIPDDISIAVLSVDEPPQHPVYQFTRVGFRSDMLAGSLPALMSAPVDRRELLVPITDVIPGNTTAAPKYDPSVKRLALALILKDHPTYRVVRAGFLNAVQHLGYQAEVVGISDTDEAAFRSVCLSLLDQNVDGVVMWLPQPDIIRKLSAAGIQVVCPHSLCADGEAYGLRANIAAAPEQIARDVVAFLAEKLAGRHGVIAVSQSSDNAQENAVTRELIRLARSSLPHVVINADLRFTEHMEKNKQLVMDYMKKTPDLLGAYTTAGAACACWAAAKRALGRDDMIIVGTDYTDETLDLVESGEVQAFVAQPLYEEAQTSVIALDTLLRGNSYPFFTSLDAPLVTRANMDRYRKLLQDVNNWYA